MHFHSMGTFPHFNMRVAQFHVSEKQRLKDFLATVQSKGSSLLAADGCAQAFVCMALAFLELTL